MREEAVGERREEVVLLPLLSSFPSFPSIPSIPSIFLIIVIILLLLLLLLLRKHLTLEDRHQPRQKIKAETTNFHRRPLMLLTLTAFSTNLHHSLNNNLRNRRLCVIVSPSLPSPLLRNVIDNPIKFPNKIHIPLTVLSPKTLEQYLRPPPAGRDASPQRGEGAGKEEVIVEGGAD